MQGVGRGVGGLLKTDYTMPQAKVLISQNLRPRQAARET
jgi:hypothetical protein